MQVNRNPTDAQKEAGNYRKAHVKVHGLDIAIENPAGSMRRGIGKDGEPWSVKMPAHYGYIKRTEGADGDHVDCYIGPHRESPVVVVIDQKDADGGDFDEHKCMLGFANEKQALATYKRGFSDGRGADRIGSTKKMTVEEFKEWLKNGDTTKQIARAAGGRIPMQSGGEADDWITPEPVQADDWAVPKEAPSTMADIGKSVVSGVGKGLTAAAGLPGDIRNLVDVGVQYAGKKLGLEPAAGEMAGPNIIPTTQGVREAIEPITGEFYEPQTTPGKFAGTATEFLANPLSYIGPGGLGIKAAQAATAGLGSEAAGQMTEGTAAEPYARVAGAIVGGGVPAAAARTVTPLPISAERQAMVDTLRAEGIQPTAGQVTGSKALRYAESHLGDSPGAGSQATAANERIGEQFTRAALARAGEQAERATPEVIDRALTRIGGQFDRLAARNNAPYDAQYFQDVSAARQAYDHLFVDPMRAPLVDNVFTHAVNQIVRNRTLDGDVYKAVRSRIERMRRSHRADPELNDFLSDMRNALDGVMERGIAQTNPADLGAWREVRTQYRNLIPIEKASVGGGEAAAEGMLSPARMRQALVGQDRRGYARGRGDFADLVRAGNVVLTPLPQSGTAPRAWAQAIPASIGAALGAPGGVATALPAAMAGAAAPGVAGRALMSAPVQSYLRNQLLADFIRRMPRSRYRTGIVGAESAFGNE